MGQYKRVLLKISGEALAGRDGVNIDFDILRGVCAEIKRCANAGTQMGVVVGGGNIWRGARNGAKMDRTRADHMGMLATVINSLALADVFESLNMPVRVQTALEMREITEQYARARAVRHLEKGRVVIFACGLGSPFFSTDTAAVLRGVEIGADVVLLAKNIDGVYSADPSSNPDAVKFDEVSYEDVLQRRLGVMDLTATSLGMDNRIPVYVFALRDPGNIYRAVMGEKIGTLVE
ncbi:MAG: UMP kinase [Oscillospiraceae bacterium]|nr:UMP kinase [Oscillospiraceae bacterium]